MIRHHVGGGRVGGGRIGGSGLASLAGVLVAAAALTGCANVAGTPSAPGISNALSSAASTALAASSAPTSTAVSSSSASSSTAASSSTGSSRAIAVPGLPHATPLPDNILLGTRSVGGSEDLYQIDTTTGQVGEKLTKGASGPQFPILSPDRGTVVYLQSGDGLRTMAVDGSGDRELFATLPEGCDSLLRPAWNPIDPTELAVACVKSDGNTDLKLVGIDGTVRSTLNPGIAHLDDLAYSPDGTTLLYWGSANTDDNGGPLYLQSADGKGLPKQITTPGGSNDADASFSPDGSTIIFRRATTSSSQIISIRTDGSGLTPITDGTSYDQDPSISPDGTQIAFKSTRNNAAGTSDGQIWVIGTDGTGVRQLGIGSAGIADGAPAWGHR